ncbi:MAG TPA: hypothetical protein DCY89_03795 [Gammaproteobacteria bacterium]|nr:hypothetical protein [Gammaproteobacteria bacterium]
MTLPRLTCLLMACLPAAAFAAEVVRWTGYATDLATGAPVYSERHEAVIEDGRAVRAQVEYVDPTGKPIAAKTLDFVSPFLPLFSLADSRIGYREGIRREGEEIMVFMREPGADRDRERSVTVDGEVVADAGFDQFMRQHLEGLARGERKVFDFIVPSQLRALRFRVEKVGETKRDGLSLLQLVLRPDGFILRNLVASVELDYDLASGMLYEYRGISNVRQPNGDSYRARIVFPPAERRVVSVAANDRPVACLVGGCR